MQAQLGLGSLAASPLVRGAFVGFAATQTLDALSAYLHDRDSPFARFRGDRSRGFLPVYERAAHGLAKRTGIKLSRRESKTWGLRLHKTFGILSGVLYALARRKNAKLGLGGGLAAGAAFFAVADELLKPLLDLGPSPRAASWKVQARGAVSHMAYGVAAELTWRAFEKLSELSTKKQTVEKLPTKKLPTDGKSFDEAIAGFMHDLDAKSLANAAPARLA